MSAEIPYLPDPFIHGKVDGFRAALEPELGRPPVDALYIAEVEMRLEPIPLEGLWDDLRIDAALTPDLQGFYVDADTYRLVQDPAARDPWKENRLRFSVSHEIGHLILHGETLRGLCFENEAAYLAWRKATHGSTPPEYQADEFAGRLLVPRVVLDEEYDRILQGVKTEHKDWRGIPGIRERVAKMLAPRFGVNPQVIEVRLDREGIWPAE